MNNTLRLGDVVTRKADGAELRLKYYGAEIGEFRALHLGTRELVDLTLREIDFTPTCAGKNGKKLSGAETDLEDYKPEEIAKAKQWRAIIEGFNLNQHRTTKDAEAAAKKMGLSVPQFYRVRKRYDGSLRSLIPKPSSGGRGSSRLGTVRTAIVKRCVARLFVRDDPEVREAVFEAVRKACRRAKVPMVSESTILRRMLLKSPKELARGKYGPTEAKNLYGPAPGKYREGIAPLRLIQIDHTPLNLVLVDENGDEVGQAWLTIAIDVFSRMIVGLYLSYEDPSTTTVAMAIFRSVMPKEDYLKDLGVTAKWPCWGKMRTVHADNGPDLRNQNLKDACAEHQIDLHWRPLGDPAFGGHIEALAKRVNEKIRELKGRIAADFKQRKHEKPNKNGIFELRDAERYLVTWITQVYHHDYHDDIRMSPIEKYKEGIQGGERAVGVPCLPANPTQFLIDMLPSVWRTVQRDGIEIDNMRYYGNVLAKFIGLRDPKNRKLPMKFRCRTPVDDARVIYFQDPHTKQYHKIQCVDRTMPALTRRELILVNKCLKEKGIRRIDMNEIKKGYKALAQIQKDVLEKAGKSSKARKVRRQLAIKATSIQSAAPLPHRQPAPAASVPKKQFSENEIPDFQVDK